MMRPVPCEEASKVRAIFWYSYSTEGGTVHSPPNVQFYSILNFKNFKKKKGKTNPFMGQVSIVGYI